MTNYREMAINAFADAFEEVTRSDGTKYYRLRDGSPEWMADAIRDAHDGALPYDWRYAACYHIVDAMRQYDADTMDSDEVNEIAGAQVNTYMHDCIQWLAAHGSHVAAVDLAMDERCVGADVGIVERILEGQLYLLDIAANRLWDAIKAQADEMADENEDGNDA